MDIDISDFYQFSFNSIHFIIILYHGLLLFQELYVIREYLLPGWLMAVQTFVTLALMLSFTAQALLALVIIRIPLRTVLRYEWIFVSISFIMVAITSKCVKNVLLLSNLCTLQVNFR